MRPSSGNSRQRPPCATRTSRLRVRHAPGPCRSYVCLRRNGDPRRSWTGHGLTAEPGHRRIGKGPAAGGCCRGIRAAAGGVVSETRAGAPRPVLGARCPPSPDGHRREAPGQRGQPRAASSIAEPVDPLSLPPPAGPEWGIGGSGQQRRPRAANRPPGPPGPTLPREPSSMTTRHITAGN